MIFILLVKDLEISFAHISIRNVNIDLKIRNYKCPLSLGNGPLTGKLKTNNQTYRL